MIAFCRATRQIRLRRVQQRAHQPQHRREAAARPNQCPHRRGEGPVHHGPERATCPRLKAPIPLQLRELVPSQPGDGMPVDGNTDSKRPKHVVLADTIALVKSLQIKVLRHPCTCVQGGLLISSSCWTIQAQARHVQGPWRRLAGRSDASLPHRCGTRRRRARR